MAGKRVDVHHHFVPPFYVQALEEAGGDPSGWKVPQWTLEDDMRFNKEEGTAFTFLSITAPGAGIVQVSKQAAFCRQANEYSAQIRNTHPDRYGFFATIPSLLEFEAAKQEIIYALDVLKADGVTLFTRYGNANHYLGHSDFQPIWALLDTRAAVVFVHPTHPVDTALVNPNLPQPMIDYPHETTRAAVDLIMSNSLRSYPNCKVILSHAGGTLPYLVVRPASMLPHIGLADTKSTEDFVQDAKRFYFDTALSTPHTTLDLLKTFARPDHVLFGSDFPYAPEPTIRIMNRFLDEYENTNGLMTNSINSGAAAKLWPRLGEVIGA